MNNFPFGHNWCVSVSTSFTSCNLQLSRYDTLIFCCTPSIIGKFSTSKAEHFSFCGIIYFLQTFFKYAINCPLFVSASVKVNLCVLFTHIFLASVFSRTDNTSFHPYINWCLQTIVTCKKGNAFTSFLFLNVNPIFVAFFAPESIPPPASVTPGRDWALQWFKNCATVTLATMFSQQLFWWKYNIMFPFLAPQF